MSGKKKIKKVKYNHAVPIGPNDWFYAYPGHLLLVHEIHDQITGKYVRTDQIKIHWRKIRPVMPRKTRP